MTFHIRASFLVVFLLVLSYASSQEVNTTNGRVRGSRIPVLTRMLDVFYGIPFAKPPTGERRFKHPSPLDPWGDQVKDAKSPKPSCYQRLTPSMGDHSLRVQPSSLSEDCLYLNIWAPVNLFGGLAQKPSTLVWIHGGSFRSGSINLPLYDGRFLAAENDVIVVSINYRIGALGFMFLGPDLIPGNMGLMDQKLAIEWIYNNIENFGGDRNKITLMGESAGAASVSHHLLSPLSREFFKRVILQSGTSLPQWAAQTTTAAKKWSRDLAEVANCPTENEADLYDCINKLSPEAIIENEATLSAQGALPFIPVVDGYFLPDHPASMLASGNYKDAQVLLGVNKDEGTLFLAAGFPFLFTSADTLNLTRTQFTLSLGAYAASTGSDPTTVAKALMAQYEDTKVPSRRPSYLDIVDDVIGDSFFKCPAVTMATAYSAHNAVYLYSFDYRYLSSTYPGWMGTLHSIELEITFGHPLNENYNFTEAEKDLSRTVMRYWTNFAKTGNPNNPFTPSFTWPQFNTQDEPYIVLDTGSLATKMGMRKQHCPFWNTLLPMILENRNSEDPLATSTEPVVFVCSNGVGAMVSVPWLGILVTAVINVFGQ